MKAHPAPPPPPVRLCAFFWICANLSFQKCGVLKWIGDHLLTFSFISSEENKTEKCAQRISLVIEIFYNNSVIVNYGQVQDFSKNLVFD